MAWTTPRTWVVGEMVNASLLNTYLRDNLKFIRDQVSCRISRAGAAFSIGNNAFADIPFDTVDLDTGSPAMADIVSTPKRIVFQQTGKYVCGCTGGFAANGTGNRIIRLMYHDNSVNPPTDTRVGSDASEGYAASLSYMYMQVVLDCKVGDYIFAQVFQNSGAALNSSVVVPALPTLYAAREGF